MTLWNFPVDSQGWTLQNGAVHNGAEGHAGLGCIQLADDDSGNGRMTITGLSILNDDIQLYWRVRPTSPDPGDLSFVPLNVTFSDSSTQSYNSSSWYHTAADSDWMVANFAVTPGDEGKTITELLIAHIEYYGTVDLFIDDVLVGTAATGYGLTHSAGGIPGSVLI